ncbi:MAG TPA: hypothetical protein VMM77_02045 [Gemmatimonadaceae bacterium]|nr:hypothetical protein [Gemmatimonadaceae bacterium]
MRFFPQDTLEWHALEPGVVRRLSLSLVTVAVVAGVTLRLYRLAMLHVTGFVVVLAAIGGLALLAAFVTLHLGNYPLRQWIWRAPVFALVQSVASLATSALFVAAGMERIGSTAMEWPQWRADILQTLVRNSVAVCAFALMLAAGVQIVRRAMIRRQRA